MTMKTLAIKIEQMYPERKVIEQFKWNDWDRTIERMTEEVERYIGDQMNVYRHRFPEMTELRWEFEDYGQGHYIAISKKPLSVYVGRLNHLQLIDVVRKSTELSDWRMLEAAAYQLKMMTNIDYTLSAEMELPYAAYEFDWMFEKYDPSTDTYEPLEDDEPLELAPDEDVYDARQERTVYKEADNLIVKVDEIIMEVAGKQFIFTESMIAEHMAEGWVDGDITLHEIDDVVLQVKQQHWKIMSQMLNPFGS